MGVFTNALSLAMQQSGTAPLKNQNAWPGVGAWVLDRIRHRALKQPRLSLVERINIAPRQTVALIEADGQRLLVATSPDGSPSFYPLIKATGRSVGKRRRNADSEAESE